MNLVKNAFSVLNMCLSSKKKVLCQHVNAAAMIWLKGLNSSNLCTHILYMMVSDFNDLCN